MGLRCSLIGHDFGEPEIEKEREERGSEVVVTVREYEECTRCGKKHVISESTEVKSLSAEPDADRSPETPVESTAEDAFGTDDGEILEDATEPVGATDDPGPEAAAIGDEAEIVDNDAEIVADDPGEPEPTTAAESQPPEISADETGEPITDDGEILEEADTPRTDRGHGEWPDASDVGPPVDADRRPAAWPDSEDGDDVTTSADAETLEFEETVPEPEPEPEPETPTDPGTGIASAQSVPAPGRGERADDVPTEFFCPQCEFVAPGDRGSLRAGDICPECRKGYLGERDR